MKMATIKDLTILQKIVTILDSSLKKSYKHHQYLFFEKDQLNYIIQKKWNLKVSNNEIFNLLEYLEKQTVLAFGHYCKKGDHRIGLYIDVKRLKTCLLVINKSIVTYNMDPEYHALGQMKQDSFGIFFGNKDCVLDDEFMEDPLLRVIYALILLTYNGESYGDSPLLFNQDDELPEALLYELRKNFGSKLFEYAHLTLTYAQIHSGIQELLDRGILSEITNILILNRVKLFVYLTVKKNNLEMKNTVDDDLPF